MSEKKLISETAQNPTAKDAEVASKPVAYADKKNSDVEKGKLETDIPAKNAEVKDIRKKSLSERMHHAANHANHPCSLMKKIFMIVFHTGKLTLYCIKHVDYFEGREKNEKNLGYSEKCLLNVRDVSKEKCIILWFNLLKSFFSVYLLAK